MAAQPHPVTESGQSVVFENGFPAPLKACTVTLSYTQAGSENPSPSNVREITGLTGLSVHVSPTSSGGTEYPVSWTEYGTVYGGTLDVVSGLLTKSWNSFAGTDITDIKIDSYNSTIVTAKMTIDSIPTPESSTIISNRFSTSISSGNVGRMVLVKNTNALYIVMPRTDFSGTPTGNDVKQWLIDHPTTFVYPLADAVAYQLSSVAIREIRGENHIWSDAGNVSVTYYTI